jgi:hypothetical protein
MKKLALIILLILPDMLFAQNLLSNGSFETFTSCPTAFSQLNRATSWRDYHGGTCDYFNVCGSGNVGLPTPYFGYVNPVNGNGIGGGYAYTYFGGLSTYAEYPASTITAMAIGTTYEVSMYVANSLNSVSGCNGIGVRFYDNGPTTTISGTSFLNIPPSVDFSNYGVITSNMGWVHLVGYFTADSAYDNIILGKFIPPSGLRATNVLSNNNGYSYYYYDSVVVKPATGIVNFFDKNKICAGDTFNVKYTISNTTYSASNIFSVQLSDNTGSFLSGTTIIGTKAGNTGGQITCVVPSTVTPGFNYRLRILSNLGIDSSNISLQPIAIGVSKPNVSSPATITVCEGNTLNLSASSTTPGVSYAWTGPNGYYASTQNPSVTFITLAANGTYTVTSSLYGCDATSNTTVSVVAAPTGVNAVSNGPVCEGDTIALTATNATGASNITWLGPGSFTTTGNPIKRSNATPLMSGQYTAIVDFGLCVLTRLVVVNVDTFPKSVSATSNSPVCTNDTLILNGSSSTNGVLYNWTGPSSFSANTAQVKIGALTTARSGNYILTVTKASCKVKDTLTVTVNQSPVPVIATTNGIVCEHDTLFMNAITATPGATYSWTGPSSFSSSSSGFYIANAQANHSGDYIVSVTTGNGCYSKDTVSVLVKQYPASVSTTTNSPICAGDTLKLQASSPSPGVSYTWTGPGSFVSTNQQVNLLNATTFQSGSYIAIYNRGGCVVFDTISVLVKASPQAVLVSSNSPICEDDTLKLMSALSPGASYYWTGPGGYNASVRNANIMNATTSLTGSYILTSSLANGCSRKDTVTVLVKPLPANVNAGANSPICEGNTLFLTGNTSSTGVSFSWTGPNSFSSTLQNPNFSPATTNRTGNYILTATLNGCSVLDTVYAQVNPIPAAPTPSANTPVCVGQDLQLAASTIAGATYNWTSTTGYSSNVQNPVRSSATTSYAGKYYLTATVNGCVSSPDSVTVSVNAAPSINMYPSPKDSICVGQNVTFVSSNSNAGSSYTRSWFKNNNVIGGAANANYSTTTAADGDEYYVTLTAYGVCATPYTDTSSVIKMRVLPYLAPSVSISANPNTTVTSGTMINFTATPTNGGNKPGYQWTRNGTPVVGAISNIWGASTLSNNDQICVDMTSSYLCPNPKTAKSNCIKVSIESTGIVGVWTGKEPSIYPNPATEKLIIEGIDKGTKIQLNDVLGRVVVKATATNETTELNMSHLAPGSYMLTLSKDNGDSMSVKVVKE